MDIKDFSTWSKNSEMDAASLMNAAIVSAMNSSAVILEDTLDSGGTRMGQVLNDQIVAGFKIGSALIEEALHRGAVVAADGFYDRLFDQGGLNLMLWMFFVISLLHLMCILVVIVESILIIRFLRRCGHLVDGRRVPQAVIAEELTRADTPDSFVSESTVVVHSREAARYQTRDI